MVLIPEGNNRPVWSLEQNGKFTVSSAWHLIRQMRARNWFDLMSWHKNVPFKMNLILWRSVRDKIPTDARLIKMGISIPSRCCCCKRPQEEDISQLMCSGEFAQTLWKILCGPVGIPCANVPLKILLKHWWTWKTKNPISNLISKCLPAITMWELWKARCGAKYGKEKHNTKTLVHIASTISQIVKNQFPNVNLKSEWNKVALLMRSSINTKRSVVVKWLKPSISFVKVNSDGSCKEGICGGGGVIRNHERHLIFAYSLSLGRGTSNWAELNRCCLGSIGASIVGTNLF